LALSNVALSCPACPSQVEVAKPLIEAIALADELVQTLGFYGIIADNNVG